jgi:hypothetical protein
MKNERDSQDVRELMYYALRYAGRGWSVIPLHTPNCIGLCSCGDAKCGNVGKHPRYQCHFESGIINAARDEEEIKKLWHRWPDANIGVATGRRSGLLVMEVRKPEGGEDFLKEMIDENGLLPYTPVAETGDGSRQFYFRVPWEVSECKFEIRRGIVVRACKGYVVAPPSLDVNGKQYRWIGHDHMELAPVPAWLRNLLGLPDVSENDSRLGRWLVEQEILKGARKATLTSIAEKLLFRGVDRTALESMLLELNFLRCKPPLRIGEITRLAEKTSKCAGKSFVYCDLGKLKWAEKRFKDGSPGKVRIIIV